MSENGEKKEGWGFPTASRKAHYFVNAESLCQRWFFYFGPLEQGNENSPDNCVTCMKRKRKKGEV